MTAYEIRISDWSSDVCSSDLYSLNIATEGLEWWPLDSQALVSLFENVYAGGGNFPDRHFRMRSQHRLRVEPCEDLLEHIDEMNFQRWMQEKLRHVDQNQTDRKSVVMGNSVSVRVDLGGRGMIKTNKYSRYQKQEI